MLQGNQESPQIQQNPQYVPNPMQIPVQSNSNPNTLPQSSQSQNAANPQGGRGGYRGRGGRGRGGLIMCYWCRYFLPKEQANHKVAQCPYQSQARNDWWKSQLGSIQGELPTSQTEDKEN